MYQPDYEKIARKIVRTCARIKEDETVSIFGRADALEYCELIALECRKVGAWPFLSISSDDYMVRTLTEVPIGYLKKQPRHIVEMVKLSDVVMHVGTLGFDWRDPKRFIDIPEERVGADREGYRKPISDAIYLTPTTRWVGTGYPSPEQAALYGVDFEEFFETYWRAMDLDYSRLQERAAKVAKVLEGQGRVKITSPKGTALELSVAGRPIDRDDGVIRETGILNLPSGEVCCAPLETSANGTVIFDLAFYRGHKIEDLTVRFEEGRVVPLEAKAGFDIFTAVLANSHGDKDRIGELGIGLNEHITKAIGHTLTDEKIIGTVHIAIGENRTMGGVNDSDLHWDLLILQPRLVVDDTLLMEGGEFLV